MVMVGRFIILQFLPCPLKHTAVLTSLTARVAKYISCSTGKAITAIADNLQLSQTTEWVIFAYSFNYIVL